MILDGVSGGLVRADLVREQHRGFVDHPGDRGGLVRTGAEGQRQAGEGELGVVVAAQHQVVEPLVVGTGQVLGPRRILPCPCGEALSEFGGFLLGGQGRVPG